MSTCSGQPLSVQDAILIESLTEYSEVHENRSWSNHSYLIWDKTSAVVALIIAYAMLVPRGKDACAFSEASSRWPEASL